MNLDPPFFCNQNDSDDLNYSSETVESPRGSEMISSNSFCGFIFARAIDMNLDPPFFYNPLGKNDENNLIYFLETVTQGSEMISPNSFCGFISTRAIDMNLDPPFFYSRLNKNDRKNILLL